MEPHLQVSEDELLNDFILFPSSELTEWEQVQDKQIEAHDQSPNPTAVPQDQSKEKTDLNEMSAPITIGYVPRVSKNDIRRYFGNMAINTLNSGDFVLMQDLFQTFLAKDCRFERTTYNLPVEFYIPELMGGNGPLQFAHFFLGMQTMFPDMVLTIHGNRIITFSYSKLSKIVLDVECHSTKTVRIPYELWLPPEHLLNDIYSANSWDKMATVISSSIEGVPESPSSFHKWNVGDPLDIKLLEKKLSEQQQPSQQLPEKRKFTKDSDSSNNKEPSTSTGSETPGGCPLSDSASAVPTPITSSNAYYIPFQYATLLDEAALLLPTLLQHHTLGQTELVMDENQHIVYIRMCARLV